MIGQRRLTVAFGIAAAAFFLSTKVSAESISYDAATGDYLVTYECEGEGTISTTIEPHNKLAPAVESAFTSGSGGVSYNYSVSLGAASRQPLRMISMDPVQQVWGITEPPSQAMLQSASPEDLRKFQESVLATAPSGWRVIHYANRNGTARVGWAKSELPTSTFVAGSKQAGFAFASRHLPGVLTAHFLGDGAVWNLPCEGPDAGAVADTLNVIERNNYVPRFVAAPIIRVSDPFDAIAVLTSLRSHVTQLEQWGLADAAFSTQIRGYLSEAIAKLEAKDTAGGAAALGKLRAALRVRHPTLDSETVAHALPPSAISQNPVDDIRKLVTDYDRVLMARVLDFDAAYVIGRLSPAPVPPPASYDCNAPGDDQICAPVTDADGTFVVRWGMKSCPHDPVMDQDCEIKVVGYRLDLSRTPQFLEAQQIYQGLAREYGAQALPPGVHYFRVTADYRYCVRGRGFGYTPDYCDDDQMHWQTASDVYSRGPNKTTVDAH